MIDPFAPIRKVLYGSKYPEPAIEKIIAAVEKSGISLPHAAAFLEILITIQSGRFNSLPYLHRLALLADLELFLKKGKREHLSEICYIGFKDERPNDMEAPLFPSGMVKSLLSTARTESHEEVAEKIWSLLLRGDVPARWLEGPADFVGGLWTDDPLLRNKIIHFLIQNFLLEEVFAAANRYSRERVCKLPEMTFNRLLRFVEEQRDFKWKQSLLACIEDVSCLHKEQVERLLSGCLSRLSRFDHIKLYFAGKIRGAVLEGLADAQLHLKLRRRKGGNPVLLTFKLRAAGILQKKD